MKVTERTMTGTPAVVETETLKWIWTAPDTLSHSSGLAIYQMQWVGQDGKFTGEFVTGEDARQVRRFWRELEEMQKAPALVTPTTSNSNETHSDVCPKCGTYCYGDCEA